MDTMNDYTVSMLFFWIMHSYWDAIFVLFCFLWGFFAEGRIGAAVNEHLQCTCFFRRKLSYKAREQHKQPRVEISVPT